MGKSHDLRGFYSLYKEIIIINQDIALIQIKWFIKGNIALIPLWRRDYIGFL